MLRRSFPLLLLVLLVLGPLPSGAADPPIHIAFLWHMHQPIYWPGESVITTDALGRYDFSVVDIHEQRVGPYTTWPSDAVTKGIVAGMGHFGAQVSLSGSLAENLDALEAVGNGLFAGWGASWTAANAQSTLLGHPRLDLVAFGYHHPLMGLIEPTDIRRQIAGHRDKLSTRLGARTSRGIFPPETAFHPRMIAPLAAEGLEWVLVDNIHFDRAAQGYPWNSGGNLVEPNRAEQRNPDPGDWISLSGLWAPTPVSAAWGHRPHWVESVDPTTGQIARIVAVPADRYMGNEDGRGGFGALDYEGVMSQLEAYNTDPARPLLVVLHHDGDNYGGGSESYYHQNFQAFVDWLAANPARFVCTTIEDYLDRYPPDPSDVIHLEPGSWSGADNGDPEFAKWLGDPAADGYSPDRNSWAVWTAARNVVAQAESVAPGDPRTRAAWGHLLNGEASDYWYWDGAQDGIWDSHPTRAANLAIAEAEAAIGGASDTVGPTIFPPQREPYNPGGSEWGVIQPADVEIWTHVHDRGGLAEVRLRYRVDADGVWPLGASENALYAGGSWTTLPMASSDLASRTDPLPLLRAERWSATIAGLRDVLVDYYVEAEDLAGQVSRSPIEHVWIGAGGGGGGGALSWDPVDPRPEDVITITIEGETPGVSLHWGVDGWQAVDPVYWPAGTVLFGGTGPAVETPFPVVDGARVLQIGPFDDPAHPVGRVDFVLHDEDDHWDNNDGADYRIEIGDGGGGFVLDGTLDDGAQLLVAGGGHSLHGAFDGGTLYLATEATLGEDVFLWVVHEPAGLTAAPWAKAGSVPAWRAYLAQEGSNGWTGWFDAEGAADQAAGGWLEGTIDLWGELGTVPATIHVGMARYESSDGGALGLQLPLGDGDGDVGLEELFAYSLQAVPAPPSPSRTRARLLPNRPNPFNPRTTLRYELSVPSRIRLELFDARGRRIRSLEEGPRPAGPHELVLDGRGLASGVYWVRLSAAGEQHARRLVLLK